MFTIKTGDTMPALNVTLAEYDGTTPIDLTAAVTVTLRTSRPSGVIVEDAMTVVLATAGTVRYQWVAGDTDEAGIHTAEIVVAWPEGPQTFPASGTIRWEVEAPIGPVTP